LAERFCCGLRFGRVESAGGDGLSFVDVVAGTESAAKSSQLRRSGGYAMRNARSKWWTQDLRSIVYYEPEVSEDSACLRARLNLKSQLDMVTLALYIYVKRGDGRGRRGYRTMTFSRAPQLCLPPLCSSPIGSATDQRFPYPEPSPIRPAV